MDFAKMIADLTLYKNLFENHSKKIIALIKNGINSNNSHWEMFGSHDFDKVGIIIKNKNSKEKFPKRVRVIIETNAEFEICFFEGISDTADLDSELHYSSSYPLYSVDIESYITDKIVKVKLFLTLD